MMPDATNASDLVSGMLGGVPRQFTTRQAYTIVLGSLRQERDVLRAQEADLTNAIVQVERTLAHMKPEP